MRIPERSARPARATTAETDPTTATTTATTTEASTTRVGMAARLRLGLGFVLVHVACLGVIFVGWSVTALVVAFVCYAVRGFGITAIYHRGLSHRAFRMRRSFQLVGAIVANAAAQKGPLWWVGQHRIHHRVTDQPGDPHSPSQVGFARAHAGWQFSSERAATPMDQVGDLARFPELRFLDRNHYLAPVALGAACFALGAALGAWAPGLGTNGPQMLVWGFFVSTVALWHVTFSVNSFAHRFGRRDYATRDTSRNNLWVALLTMGEGWHNNHHRYPGSARQGFRRGQIDVTYAILKVFEKLRLVWDLRPVPPDVAPRLRRRVPAG